MRRLRSALFVAVVLAIGATGCAIGPPRLGDLRTIPGRDTLPGNYVAPPTTVADDVAYGPLPEQTFDVYLPPNPRAGPMPVIVFLHSGGWIEGSKRPVPEILLRQVTRAGIAVVSADYRLVQADAQGTTHNGFPVPDYDTDRLVRYLKANAATWNLDPNRLVLAGASAGGQLATLAGVAPGQFVDPTLPVELQSVSPRVLAVIDMVGISDFSTFARAGGWAIGLVPAFLGCVPGQPSTCSFATIVAASPVSYLDASDPPGYLMYGADDGLVVPATQGAPLALKWAAARGDLRRPAVLRGVRYEVAATGHNISPADQNVRMFELWLDQVIAGVIR